MAEKKASTDGGEYAGPCPFCGGKDRFRIWPQKGNGGRYWCRQCGARGDSIQFQMDYCCMGYAEALQELGIATPQIKVDSAELKVNQWAPRDATRPPEAWCKQALSVIEYAQEELVKNQAAQRWLSERGISLAAAIKARLGWISSNLYYDRAAWGLPDKQDADRIITKIFIPIGVAIPSTTGDAITRIRIRKFIGGPDNKYYILPSSYMTPMVLNYNTAKAVVVVESEFDGILLNSVGGDLINVVALGSAQAKPDADTVKILNDATSILVALDSDRAGYNGWLWWQRHFPKAVRWPVIIGKDPGEAYKGGLDLRTWVLAGLMSH